MKVDPYFPDPTAAAGVSFRERRQALEMERDKIISDAKDIGMFKTCLAIGCLSLMEIVKPIAKATCYATVLGLTLLDRMLECGAELSTTTSTTQRLSIAELKSRADVSVKERKDERVVITFLSGDSKGTEVVYPKSSFYDGAKLL